MRGTETVWVCGTLPFSNLVKSTCLGICHVCALSTWEDRSFLFFSILVVSLTMCPRRESHRLRTSLRRALRRTTTRRYHPDTLVRGNARWSVWSRLARVSDMMGRAGTGVREERKCVWGRSVMCRRVCRV